jgi:hypothetical protein
MLNHHFSYDFPYGFVDIPGIFVTSLRPAASNKTQEERPKW